jgi:cysteinyl-tRNA synthetase
MEDDLNTGEALGAIFELVRDINSNVITDAPVKGNCEAAAKLFDELCDVLGLVYDRKEENLDTGVEELIAQRTQARKDKNWAEADRIRDELKARGIEIIDTPQGAKWRKV